jgi:hypothetical protein
MKEIKFYNFTLDEVAHFIYAIREKKPLNKTDKKIFKKLQEIGKKESKKK